MASIASLSSSATNSVVFPPPPPTTNTLTLEQRAHLRKSTTKLRKILGITPHLLDTDIVGILGPVHVQLPPRKEPPSPVLSESSVDSYSSRSSSSCSSYPVHPYSACASFEAKSSTPPSVSHARQNGLRLRPSSAGRVTDKFDSVDIRAPLLRLAVSPPSPISSISSISSCSSSISSPSRTSARSNLIYSRSRSKSVDNTISTPRSVSSMKFTLLPTRPSTSIRTDDTMVDPSCKAPSPSTIRRQKMDRLRKVLGDNVPIHLVFPDQKPEPELVTESEVDYADECSSSSTTPIAVAGTAVHRPKKASSGKIIAARDSMGLMTPHRAKRQEKQKSEKPLSPLPPSPPIVIPASCIPKDQSQPRHLRVIVESPEEHGSSSFEGFGFGSQTLTKKSSVVLQSSWKVRDGTSYNETRKEEENKVWSTRRGYTGWNRATVVGKPEQEKKRAMSYRKPPPPI